MTRLTTVSVALLLVAASACVPAANAASQPEHEHAHDTGAALVSKLELDQGKPWPTDAALREGMAAIRNAFDADHGRIHAGEQTDAQYDALAARIETQVGGIVAACKLPAAADTQLHYVVGDLLQGVALMHGQDPAQSRHAGAARVHGALLAYPEYFDDPAWRSGSDPAPGHEHQENR